MGPNCIVNACQVYLLWKWTMYIQNVELAFKAVYCIISDIVQVVKMNSLGLVPPSLPPSPN